MVDEEDDGGTGDRKPDTKDVPGVGAMIMVLGLIHSVLRSLNDCDAFFLPSTSFNSKYVTPSAVRKERTTLSWL